MSGAGTQLVACKVIMLPAILSRWSTLTFSFNFYYTESLTVKYSHKLLRIRCCHINAAAPTAPPVNLPPTTDPRFPFSPPLPPTLPHGRKYPSFGVRPGLSLWWSKSSRGHNRGSEHGSLPTPVVSGQWPEGALPITFSLSS